uniref:Acyl-[acyl-carrier-protein] desaturase 6, chloroplastic n=1 Tax=Zeugodacus cucurbitae TaxID=28588 RepID=A0A0A1WR58_ZEUCU
MANSNNIDEQEYWIEFIELYKSKPVLWKYGSEIYKDRKGKKRAYVDLVEKLREVEPNADVDMVKKKINSFRSCYRRKMFNAQEQIKLGLQPEIKWVYYKHLNFLREINNPLTEDQSWRHSDDTTFTNVENLDENDDDAHQQVVEYMADKSEGNHRLTYSTSPPISLNDSIEETSDQANCSNNKNSLKVMLNAKKYHKFWIEFIKLYSTKPELWKVNSEIYKDREAKKYAYMVLTEKLREVQPDATAELVRKKINVFRTSYRKAQNKMKRAISLGRKPVNNWVYFDHFAFLHESKDPLVEDDTWNEVEEDNDCSMIDITDNSVEHIDYDPIVEEMDAVVEFSPTKNSTKIEHDSQPSSDENITVSHTELNNLNQEGETKPKFWIEFIKLYRSKPELWKYGSAIYKDSKSKRSAYLELVKKLREIYPNADVGMVKRKLNSFRSIYRNILSKMSRGERLNGKPAGAQWIYFNHLSFLSAQNEPLDEDDDWNDNEDKEYRQVDNLSENNLQDDFVTADESDLVVQFLTTKESTKRQYTPTPTRNESAHNERTDSSFKKFKQNNDEADILGISWAYQYRSLSETQKIFAKKAIDDVLFEARLETLQRNSVKINERQCERCKHA